MPKSKKEITKNERKILDTLTKNARQNLIELSEKTGLSRQTVQKTIQKLEKEHVIWGYKPIIDEQKKGLKEYIILIKRSAKPVDEKLINKVILEKIDETESKIGIIHLTSLYTDGNFDFITYFMASDIKTAKKYIEFIKTMYSDYITDIQLLESLFSIRKQGIFNPNTSHLKQFLL